MSEGIPTFKRNDRGDSSHGNNFEWETTLLWYMICVEQEQKLRKTNNSGVKSFYVANNVRDVGAFDDVVVGMECIEKGVTKTKLIFLHCKHVEGDSEKKFKKYLGEPEIEKYFQSFMKIYKVFKVEDLPSDIQLRNTKKEENEFFVTLKNMPNCEFLECEFWFFSNINNINAKNNLFEPYLPKTGTTSFQFFDTLNLVSEYRLCYNSLKFSVVKDKASIEHNNLFYQFRNSFRVFFNVGNVSVMVDRLIQNLITEDTKYFMKDDLRDSLLAETKYILKSCKLLTEKSNLISKIMHYLYLKKSTEDLIIKHIPKHISGTKIASELISNYEIKTKTQYQRLGKIKLYESFFHLNHHYLCLLLNTEADFKKWNIARETDKYKSMKKIYIYFGNSLLLPVEKKEPNEEYVQLVFIYEMKENSSLLQQLSAEDIDVIENSLINVQGHCVIMKNFCSNWMQILDENAICDILESKLLMIDSILPSVSDFYLQRKFKIKILGVKIYNQLQRLIAPECNNKYILFSQQDNDSEISCRSFETIEEATTFLPQMKVADDNIFYFCTFFNNVMKLRLYGTHTNCLEDKIVDEDYFTSLKSKSKVTVLTDVAGMGKSTSMLKIALNYKTKNESHTVYFIELRKYIENFATKMDTKTTINAVQFVASTLLKLEGIENKIFINACNETGKVALFFDAFDELSAGVGKAFSQLLVALERTQISCIFVSSRQKFVDIIEKYLLLTPIQFLELSFEEKESCLKEFWNKMLESRALTVKEQKLKVIVKKIISILEKEENLMKEILSIPLQIRMVAETYFDQMLEYCKNEIDFNIKLDLISLYENFMKSHAKHFYTEKLNVNWNVFQEPRKERYIREKLRFIPKVICSIVVPNLFHKNIKERSDVLVALRGDLGLTTDIDPPRFLHKKIADYLAAMYVVGTSFSKVMNRKTEEILHSILIDDEYDVLRKFVNSLLDVDDLPIFFKNVMNDDETKENLSFKTTPVHVAASEGNIRLLKALLRRNNLQLNLPDSRGRTPLHYACFEDRKEVVDYLVSIDCLVNIHDNEGRTAFYDAAFKGKNQIMELLLKRDKSLINIQNIHGDTPLHVVCFFCHVGSFDTLINNNCSVNERNKFGVTAFYHAAWKDQVHFMEILLKRNKSLINMQNKSGNTPLQVASLHGNIEAVKWLISNGCSAMKFDNLGCNAFHVAATKDHATIMELLLKHDSSLIDVKGNVSTPLHIASSEGSVNAVKFLISHGCSVNEIDNKGSTAFNIAAAKNQTEIMEILLQSDKSLINIKNKFGTTPLHSASYFGNNRAVKFLLSNDCSVKDRYNNGNTAVHYAVTKNNIEIMEILLQYDKSLINMQNNFGRTPLHVASFEVKNESINFLLKNGCSVDMRDNHCCTAFHYAARNEQIQILEHFLQRDTSLINSKNKFGSTPLHLACYFKKVYSVKFLVSNGCSVNEFDNYGHTALHVATSKDNFQILEFLLHHDSSLIDFQSKEGKTPLHSASAYGNERAVSLLLSYNCSLTLRDKNGGTAYHEAIHYEQIHVMDILLRHDRSLLNMRHEKWKTPLHYACLEGKIKAAEFIFNLDPLMKEIDFDGFTAFHVAVQNEHIHIMKLLLKRDQSLLNMQNENGKTPLQLARSENKINAFMFLEHIDFSKNFRDNICNIVNNYAAWKEQINSKDIVSKLNKYLFEMQDTCSKTFLYLTCSEGIVRY